MVRLGSPGLFLQGPWNSPRECTGIRIPTRMAPMLNAKYPSPWNDRLRSTRRRILLPCLWIFADSHGTTHSHPTFAWHVWISSGKIRGSYLFARASTLAQSSTCVTFLRSTRLGTLGCPTSTAKCRQFSTQTFEGIVWRRLTEVLAYVFFHLVQPGRHGSTSLAYRWVADTLEGGGPCALPCLKWKNVAEGTPPGFDVGKSFFAIQTVPSIAELGRGERRTRGCSRHGCGRYNGGGGGVCNRE